MEKFSYPYGRGIYHKARAKINLTLEVGKAREDGYHEVSMLMQSLRLWDDVELFLGKEDENTVECNIPFFKADEKNIAFRALTMMQEKFGLDRPVHMRLYKKIPIAAGLAGGSTDAAAAIRGMNKLFHLGLSTEELMRIGGEIGSDVPFCILGGTCLATGRGEKVKPVIALPTTYVVLIKPDFSISTPWSYKKFDEEGPQQRPDLDRMLRVIASGNIKGMQAEMINMLEAPAAREYPVILELKERLCAEGADAAAMSGSGPTVFGIFKSEEKAKAAYLRIRSAAPYRYQVIFSSTENPRFQTKGVWK